MSLATKFEAPTGSSYVHSAHERTGFREPAHAACSDESGVTYVLINERAEGGEPELLWDLSTWLNVTRAAYLRAEALDVVSRHAVPGLGVKRSLHTLALNTVDRDWTRLAAGLEELFKETPFEAFEGIPERVEHPAARAFDELAEWLAASNAQVARAAGLGRTTRYAWSREGHAPRPSTVRRLYEIHSAVEALRRTLGPIEFGRWLHNGDPSPRDLLLDGATDVIQPAIREFIFRPTAKALPDLAAAPEPVDEAGIREHADAEAPRSSGRRRRTARI